MKPMNIEFSNRPYRMGGDYPSITVVFDYETKPLEGVMCALGAISSQRLRKTKKHGWVIGVGSTFGGSNRQDGPIWLKVSLPIEPGNVMPLRSYIEEAQSIAEAAVFQGLNMKVALGNEQKRVGDGIIVSLDSKHFTYSLKSPKHTGVRRVESSIVIDDEGFVYSVVPRDPASLYRELLDIEAEAAAREAERNKYTPDQRAEMRRQEREADKKTAERMREQVKQLRAEALTFSSAQEKVA